MNKPKVKSEKERQEEKLVESVTAEFIRRQSERKSLERQWELNLNFLRGNQYLSVSRRGELVYDDKEFFWQNRGVFNHIAPIMESRLAKLARVTPTVYVRPLTDDDDDVKSAQIAEKLISETFKNCSFEDRVKETTSWSEICGTGFYKIIWNAEKGNVVGNFNGENVKEGDVEIVSVSPFEIFPDNLYSEEVENCSGIMHAKAVPVTVIKERYGVDVVPDEIDAYNLTAKTERQNKKSENTVKDAAIVIEDYIAPTKEYPDGRLIIVAAGKLLYDGVLPYKTGASGKRSFPFVKQQPTVTPGSFFGSSIIERLIPVQRAYNAVKNRKHEFLNRLTNGVMTVEDGSVDIDELAEDGLSPGKVVVYRQGSKAPEMMNAAAVPPDFSDEEEKLVNEFVAISGVSDVSSSSKNAKLSSGSALELLIEQDNERLTAAADIIRKCYMKSAKHVLRMFRQFTSGVKAIKSRDSYGRTKVYYAGKKTLLSDDVYLESENELMYTPTQKKNVIFQLYQSGILSSESGKLSASTKEKVLSLLGYKDLDSAKGIAKLQEEKAEAENEKIRKGATLNAEEIDDDEIHVGEHTRYVLSEYEELTSSQKQRLMDHIAEHKNKIKQKQLKTEGI
ncbi:MAG: hypothetical protein SPL13_03940 [Clostridia bacterium]|nr:hypothetical protein [Clostridia bacterium]